MLIFADRKPARASYLIANGADLSVKNKAGFSAFYFVNKKVPQCMKIFEERLDNGLKLEGSNSDMNAKIKLDFNNIASSVTSYLEKDIAVFVELMDSPHVKLLNHPLMKAFLYLKWHQIKYLYYFCVLFCHFTWSVIYSTYALLVYRNICEPPPLQNRTDAAATVECDFSRTDYRVNIAIASWILLIMFGLVYLIKTIMIISNRMVKRSAGWSAREMIKMSLKQTMGWSVREIIKMTLKSYWEIYNDIIIIISVILISFHTNPFNSPIQLVQWQFHVAAIGVFYTWLQMMFAVGRVPGFGQYVQMFK